MLKYRGNLRDQWVDFKYWCLNWFEIMKFIASNPPKVTAALFKYPPLYDLLKSIHLTKTLNEGRTGTAFLVGQITSYLKTKGAMRFISNLCIHTQDSILENCMIPIEISSAMDLKIIPLELLGNFATLVDQHASARYLDVIDNKGLPADACSFTRLSAGLFAAGALPKNIKALVSNNLPCEGGIGSHAYYRDNLDCPVYTLDVPYNFHDNDALDAFVEDMRGMISFLEEHTGHRMDWNKLREICERSNQIDNLELENWEMVASEIPPISGDNLWLLHFWVFNVDTGRPESLQWYKTVNRLVKDAYQRKEPAFKNMRYRTFMWNTPPVMYSGFWNWLERCWGVAVLNDMMTFGHLEDMFIDTSTEKSMLKALAKRWCNASMARHTRGPSENFLNDIWTMAERFHADFFLVPGHIGCRSSVAMTGVMKEECRKRNLPICIFEYELSDPRVCSRQGIRDQVNSFMFNVMKAKPLDESLLVFDDSNDW
jgi:benzoyl-CoA reductase/2-hydroxyglutaryl-CoA dehydratase subunit BcrC/BadD/HgdB